MLQKNPLYFTEDLIVFEIIFLNKIKNIEIKFQ